MAGSGVGTQAARALGLDARLNSVGRVLAALDRQLAPVPPVRVAPGDALGAICASDVTASGAVPARDEALIDGRAVASAELIGASPMSPVYVMQVPVRVRVGDPLPPGCDCVIEDALVSGMSAPFEIHGAAAPGDGTRRAGEDLKAEEIIIRAGEQVSPSHVLALAAAGIDEIEARRPRVRIVMAQAGSGQPVTSRLIGELTRAHGALVEMHLARSRDTDALAEALRGAWDAALIVGGTGASVDDHSVDAVSMSGEVVAHGLALDPGRTGAAGLIDGRPVICIPGRFDGALSVFLAIVRPLLLRLSGANAPPVAREARLARKIASTVGLSQLVLLRVQDGAWMPLGVGDVTISGLLRAHAYLLLQEGSEGLAENAVLAPILMPGRSSIV